MLSAVTQRLTQLHTDIADGLSLFCVDLGGSAPSPQIRGYLCASERTRAAAFRYTDLAARFVWCRAALRQILGARLACPPKQVALQQTDAGRPFVADAGFDFNVSHSGDLALIALLDGHGRVGVDIERLVPLRDMDKLAETVFTAREREILRRERGTRLKAFYRLWTCKESYLKAIGTGLMVEPSRVDIDLENSRRPSLRQAPDARPCRIETFCPVPDFIAALTVCAAASQ